MTLPQRDAFGFFHPRSEEEVVGLVRWARSERRTLRVRGAGHSVPAAIHGDERLTGAVPRHDVELKLDGLTDVRFDDAARTVTVGAGRRLGKDPQQRWPDHPGLCELLDARGWALPNLGGITHQTVSGFLTTGSAGGSVQYDLHACVLGLRLVDGQGTVHVLDRTRRPDDLDAVAVSMGLCGVITELTLQCIEAYDVEGDETVFDGALPDFDPFADGPTGFEALLRREPYARLLWWAQRRVNRFQLWRARRVAADAPKGQRVPYLPIEPIAGSVELAQKAAAFALGSLGGWRSGIGAALGRPVVESLEWAGAEAVEAALIRSFTPLGPPKPFRDAWHRALPMDDGMSDTLLPTSFTELWLPLERSGEVMRRLKALYATVPEAAGHFAVELYAGAASSFWLSPGNLGPAIRLNPFWYDGTPGDPRASVFRHLFDTFDDLGYRLHWGKALPLDAVASAAQLRRGFPRWDDFLERRAAFDPDGVFLTPYWRAHLGLSQAPPTVAHAAPLPRASAVPAPPPLRFTFDPCDETLLETAGQHLVVEETIDAPAAVVSEWMGDIARTHEWMPGFQAVDFLPGPGRGERGAVFDEHFSFMTIRVRLLREVPGEAWVAVVDGCTLPLASRMVQHLRFTPLEGSRTHVRWHIAFDVPLPLRPFFPMVGPLFRQLFARGLATLGRLARQGQVPPAPGRVDPLKN